MAASVDPARPLPRRQRRRRRCHPRCHYVNRSRLWRTQSAAVPRAPFFFAGVLRPPDSRSAATRPVLAPSWMVGYLLVSFVFYQSRSRPAMTAAARTAATAAAPPRPAACRLATLLPRAAPPLPRGPREPPHERAAKGRASSQTRGHCCCAQLLGKTQAAFTESDPAKPKADVDGPRHRPGRRASSGGRMAGTAGRAADCDGPG